MADTTSTQPQHRADCPRPGYRYASFVRATAATRAAGTAGRVVMQCKGCPARKLV